MYRVILSALVATALSVAANAQTLYEIVQNSPDHNLLEVAIDTAGLAGVLDDADADLTLFAPDDDAFNALGQATLDALLADSANLRNILLYHVLGEEVLGADFPAGQSYSNSALNSLSIQVVNENGITLNASSNVAASVDADNGVVHVIDAIILPMNVTQVVTNSPAHDTLQIALDSVGLLPQVGQIANSTLFAPTDAAFGALPAGALDDLLVNNQGALFRELLYHLLLLNGVNATPAILGDNIYFFNSANTQSGNFGFVIEVESNGSDRIVVNGVEAIITSINATNGVVHVIDELLTPPSIGDFIDNSLLFNTLADAKEIAGLDDILDDDSAEFTIFAPTDGAFNAVDPMTLAALVDDSAALREVLLYHAIGENLGTDDLDDGLSFENSVATYSLQFQSFNDGDSITVDNNSLITRFTNRKTTNGTFNLITSVLLPPDVVDIAVRSPVHNTLVTQVVRAGLAGTLSDPMGEYTVFAPTDAAFAGVDPDFLGPIVADSTGQLVTVLTYHVLGSAVTSDEIVSGNITTATTLQGEEVTIEVSNGMVVLDGNVTVIIADIIGTNGVVHAVNGVLVPDAISSTESVLASDGGIAVGPIPADDFTQVTLPEDMTSRVDLDILDANGRVVSSRTLLGQNERVELGDLSSGTYFLSFRTEGARYHQPIVVR